jgi:hypothetical protein
MISISSDEEKYLPNPEVFMVDEIICFVMLGLFI